MLTCESLRLIFDELEDIDRVIVVFSGLIPPYPIGDVCLRYFQGHLTFLVDIGCRQYWICNTAAYTGSLESLKYAHENGCPWDEDTCVYAARARSLECLKYAHENGCPWNEETCGSSAVVKSLECLEYAHSHGCPWDRWTYVRAAWSGSFECLEYLKSNGCPQ